MLVDQLHLPLSIVAPPPMDLVGGSLTALQCAACLRGLNELGNPMKYSKFADENVLQQRGAVNSKVGFLIIYTPALLVALHFLMFKPQETVLVPILLGIHFGKRIVEALTLHDFSGSKGMLVDAAIQISSYYAFVTFMIASNAVPAGREDTTFALLGLIMFAMGELNNLYHHWLLKELKEERREQSRRYLRNPRQ